MHCTGGSISSRAWVLARIGRGQPASAKAATDTTFDKVHAYDYMVYAHRKLGQDRAARSVLADARKFPNLVGLASGEPADALREFEHTT